ncbi:MAG: DNA internalization-related competence protein ComEC/Rec2, partial [FCB group bacterium]|nr:DNA internalization-related competence protein ComEC/Rec2 [FCB group bacterium]
MNRPLVWVALAIAAGIGAAAMGAASQPAVVVLVFILGLVFSFLPWRTYYLQPLGVVLVFAAVGALSYSARHTGLPGDPLSRAIGAARDRTWTFEGRVHDAQLWHAADRTQNLVLDVERARAGDTELSVRGRVFVRGYELKAPVYTDERVRLTGQASIVLGEVNPGVLGYEDYLRRRGIHSYVSVAGRTIVRQLPARPWQAGHWGSRLRQVQAAHLARTVPEDTLPFVLCVWLGDSLRSSDDVYQAYVDSGTAHILSVSGLHLAIVFASAQLVLRMMVRRERLRMGLVLVTVWAFAFAAGASVACVRAAAMVTVYLAGLFFRRDADAASSLGLSASAILLANPGLLLDAGFQLSFLSIASILLYAEPLAETLTRVPRALGEPVGATLSAQILPLPVVAHAFHTLPLAAPLANLAVVPLLTAVLWLTFLTVASGLLPGEAASLFGHALALPVYLIRAVAQGVSSLPGVRLTLLSPTLPVMGLYLAAAAAFWMALKRPNTRRMCAAAGLLAVTVAFWRPLTYPAELVFLDVGAGDAAFVRTAGGTTLLIDGGNRLDRNGRERVVVPYLQSNHVRRLDYVIASHSDADHLLGLMAVVEKFDVGAALLARTGEDDPAEAPFLALCARREVPVYRLARGDAVTLEGGRLEALYPPQEGAEGLSSNNRSLVLRLEWSGPSVLFAGDIEEGAEGRVAEVDCRADILKVPHHGSLTSSSVPFIEAVAPQQCIVSTGRLNGRLLAKDAVLERYRARNAGIWRTDYLGGIRVTPVEGGYRMESTR